MYVFSFMYLVEKLSNVKNCYDIDHLMDETMTAWTGDYITDEERMILDRLVSKLHDYFSLRERHPEIYR